METFETVQKKIERLKTNPACPGEVWDVINALLPLIQQQTDEIVRPH